MNIGKRIKQIRKQKKISVEYLANELGVSKTTIYRYEDSTIEKIPLQYFDKLCKLLDVSAAELMGNVPNETEIPELPKQFDNAQDAIEFITIIPNIIRFFYSTFPEISCIITMNF